MLIGIDASRASRARRTGTEAYSLHLIQALIEAGCNHRFRLYTPIQISNLKSQIPNLPGLSARAGKSPWPGQPALASPRRPGDGQISNLEVRVIPFPRLWTHLRLAWELKRRPPDVLFVPAHVMPLVCPVPAVVTIHDLGYLHYPAAHRPFDRWYLDWTTRRHARRAAHLIADSQATRADLIRYYRADPARITVVYPGRDESLAKVDDPAAIRAVKARYGVGGDYLLYLGTLQPRKNLIRLVEAFSNIKCQMSNVKYQMSNRKSQIANPKSQISNLQLVLAGHKGWLYADLFARVEALGLSDRVVFTGYVADADKAALLSGALALVYPSLYEGFGLPALEAMACGTPVLTSNVSSLPEVAGDAALLVNPLDTDAIADGMARLIADAGLRRSLIEKGYTRVLKFSWADAARQVLQVLESLVYQPTI